MSVLKPFLPYILLPVAFLGGIMYEKHTSNPPAVTVPPCPDAVLKVQSLDIGDLKRIRGGFTYAPQYSGTIVVCDTMKK